MISHAAASAAQHPERGFSSPPVFFGHATCMLFEDGLVDFRNMRAPSVQAANLSVVLDAIYCGRTAPVAVPASYRYTVVKRRSLVTLPRRNSSLRTDPL